MSKDPAWFNENVHHLKVVDGRARCQRIGLERLFFEANPAPPLYNNNIGGGFHDACWDGEFLYAVVPSSPTLIWKIDPEDLSVEDSLALPNDGDHNGGYGIVYAFGSLWIGNNEANWSITRVDPVTMTEIDNILIAEGSMRYGCTDGTYVYFVTFTDPGELIIIDPTDNSYTTQTIAGCDEPRCVRYFCGYLWIPEGNAFPSEVHRVTPHTWANVALSVGNTPLGGNQAIFYDIGSDGSHVYACVMAGGAASQPACINKIEPETPAVVAKTALPKAIFPAGVEPHYWAFDGKSLYLMFHDQPSNLLKINPDDLSWQRHTFPVGDNDAHGLIWTGRRLYMFFATSPGRIRGFTIGPMSTVFEEGVTVTFSTAGAGTQNMAVLFHHPFGNVPTVIVSLQDVTDNATIIGTVEAESVTALGFTARCNVHVAGGGGSTAKFAWLAIGKDMGNLV